MPIPALYCKAYPAERLRAFSGFNKRAVPLRVQRVVSGDAGGSVQDELEYFYLHADYRVRASIFIDSDALFSDITPEWKAFCETQLQFRVPAEVTDTAEGATSAADSK